MINSYTFTSILTNYPKSPTIFQQIVKTDRLNNFVKDIFIKLNIPKDDLIYSLCYLYKFVKIDENNLNLILNNKKLFLFTSIIIYFKFNNDLPLNILYICEIFKINYNEYCNTELLIILKLNWNLFLSKEKLNSFKKSLEHYKDLDHILDFLNSLEYQSDYL